MQIFFDLDGPILDVSEKYYAIYTDLLLKYGHKTLSKAEYWESKRACAPESEIICRTCPPSFAEPYTKERLSIIG